LSTKTSKKFAWYEIIKKEAHFTWGSDMPVQPKSTDSSPEPYFQPNEQKTLSEVDEKIPQAIPPHIAKPEESPSENSSIDFSAKPLVPGDVPKPDTAGRRVLNGEQKDSTPELSEENASGYEEMSDEELELLLANMDEMESGIDNEALELDQMESEVDNQKLELDGEDSEIDDMRSQLNTLKQEEVNHIENVTSHIENELDKTSQANTPITNANPTSSTHKSNKNHTDEIRNLKMKKIYKQYELDIKTAKEHPGPRTQEMIKQWEAEINAVRNKSISVEEFLKSKKNEDGTSWDDLDIEDFEKAVSQYFNRFYTPTETKEVEKHEEQHKDVPAEGHKEIPDHKKAEKEEKQDAKLFARSEGLMQSRLSQERANRIEHAKEKLEKAVEKRQLEIIEQRRSKEIEKTEIAKGQDKEMQCLEQIKIICKTLTFPVKKETLNTIVTTIREVQKLPGLKNDPELREIQRTLVSFYANIKQAVGVEVESGVLNTPQVNTKA